MTKHPSSFALLLLLLCFVSAAEVRADPLVNDPTGDTFGSRAVQHGITSMSAVFTGSSITFTVNFAGSVFAPSSGSARGVVGFIDIDADQDPATGIEPAVNIFAPGPLVLLGSDFTIDLFSEEFQPGQVDIFSGLFDPVGTAPITYGVNSFSVMVSLALLGGSDGLVNYAVLVGTFLEATDRAPNGSLPLTSTPVPEPTTLLLLGSGLAGVAAKVRGRRGGNSAKARRNRRKGIEHETSS